MHIFIKNIGLLVFSLVLVLATPQLGAQNPAARKTDLTTQGLPILTGAATVLIGGQPAARTGDQVQCLIAAGVPPVPTPSICTVGPGSATVLIEGGMAAHIGTLVIGTNLGVPAIITGESSVIIGD